MTGSAENLMQETVVWEKSGDPEYPFVAQLNGLKFIIRINNFPANELYTLIVNSEEVADFDDWPEAWVQLQQQPVAAD